MFTLKPGIATKISFMVGFLAAFISILVGLLVHNGSKDIIFNQELDRLKYETRIKAINILDSIESLTLDALYLVETPPISGIPRAYFNQGIDPSDMSRIEDWKKRLETIFSELIRAKPNYQQIRFIGIKDGGREIVRVDRVGTNINSVVSAKLQRKGNSRYFKQAASVNPGDVFISDLTLNREHGKIVKPYQPVIRAATPIYYDGSLFGIVVINMDFRNIFDRLIESTPRSQMPFVINEQGYFLANPNSDLNFGFDLGHNSNINDIYQTVNLNNSNDIREKELTYFEKKHDDINVIHIVKANFDSLNPSRFIAVALATSNANLNSESNKLRNYAFILIGFLAVVSFLLSTTIATKLLRPLRIILKASEDIAAGRVVDELPIEAKDEIGDLARSFDAMNKKLEENEQALIKSQAEAHHINKMTSLGEMASGMAHEINSPIHEISMIAERIIRRGKTGNIEGTNEAMEQIKESVRHVSNVIESLSNVSRKSESDAYELILIRDILKDVNNLSQQRLLEEGISFSINYAEDCEDITFECQRLQITQVLINLVNNAFDAVSILDQRWIDITVKVTINHLLIYVTDSGDGIDDLIQEKIFNPMFTSKKIGKGTGLGLSISATIIDNHSGKLSYNNQSENTQFVIQLPLNQENKKINLQGDTE